MKYIRNTRTHYVCMVRRDIKFYYVKDKLLDENNENHQAQVGSWTRNDILLKSNAQEATLSVACVMLYYTTTLVQDSSEHQIFFKSGWG